MNVKTSFYQADKGYKLIEAAKWLNDNLKAFKDSGSHMFFSRNLLKT